MLAFDTETKNMEGRGEGKRSEQLTKNRRAEGRGGPERTSRHPGVWLGDRKQVVGAGTAFYDAGNAELNS